MRTTACIGSETESAFVTRVRVSIAGVAILLLAVPVLLWNWGDLAHFVRTRRTAAMLADIARAGGSRSVEPRLTAELPYLPLVRLPSQRPSSSAALTLLVAATENPTPENLHAAGVAALLSGRRDEAVGLLERAVFDPRRDPIATIRASQRPDVLSDLAAAHYERGRERDSASDWTLAFTAASRAVELDRDLAPAHYVLALALEALGLFEDAAEAWNAYLLLDASSPWATEARLHLRRLSEIPRARQERTFVEEDLIGRWAEAVLSDDSALARRMLEDVRVAATAVARDSADRTVLDAVHVIDRESGIALQRLAAAHLAYRDARRLMERARDGRARDALQSSAQQLAAAGSPLSHRAAIYAATITHYLGENDEADAALLATLETLREEEYPVAVGQAIWIRSLIAIAHRRPHDALELASRAARTLERTREASMIAGIETVLADVQRYVGNTEEAWRHRLRAFRALDAKAPYMRRQLLLAETSRAATNAGYLALAKLLIRRMAINASRERDSVFSARALLSESEILRASSPPDDRRALLALDRAWSVLNSRPVTGSTNRYLADIAIARAELLVPRDPAAAASLLEDVVRRLEALDHRSRFSRIHLLLGRARQALGDAAGAESAYLRGIDEFESERATVPFDQQRSVFTDTGRPLYEAAVQLRLARGADAGALSIVRRARGAGAVLPDGDEVRIDYFVLPRELLVWRSDGGATRVRRVPIAAERLTALIERHVSAIRGGLRAEETGAELFDLLLASPERIVPANTHIAMAPDAQLHLVPFASLYDLRTRRFAAELFALTILPGSRARASDGPYRSALIVAAPQASAALPRLEHVTREVRDVAGAFRAHLVLDGNAATPERFLAEAGRHEVVHFAGHAVTNEQQPAFGSLRLAATRDRRDGALYAYEIESRQFPHTRLVVLSACDTAAGRLSGSGALSFARAFTAAGIPEVIGSLWRVEDQTTAKIFAVFYAALRNGARPAEALRTAQRDAITSSDRNHPASWAAFQLYASDSY